MTKDQLQEFKNDVEISDKLIKDFENRILDRFNERLFKHKADIDEKQKGWETNISKLEENILDQQNKVNANIAASISEFEIKFYKAQEDLGKVINEYIVDAKNQNKEGTEKIRAEAQQFKTILSEIGKDYENKGNALADKFTSLENEFKQENAISISEFEKKLKETKDDLEKMHHLYKDSIAKKIKQIWYAMFIGTFIIVALNVIVYILK